MVKAAVERPEQDRNSRQKPATAVLIPQAARRAAVLGTPMPCPGAALGGAQLLVALQSTGVRLTCGVRAQRDVHDWFCC